MKNLKKQTFKSLPIFVKNLFNTIIVLLKSKLALYAILTITFLFIVGGGLEPSSNASNLDNSFNNEMSVINEDIKIANIKRNAKQNLISEVDSFMKSYSPDNKIDPELLVDLCNQYEMQISFVLSQGLLESHFGTKGKAAQTNSVFNVGTYDDGTILYTYNNPNKSIEPYLRLLKNKYLIDKEVKDLIKDKGYVNKDGHRFASYEQYEKHLRKFMLDIEMNTQISFYQHICMLDDKMIAQFFGDNTFSYETLQAIK